MLGHFVGRRHRYRRRRPMLDDGGLIRLLHHAQRSS